MSEKQKYLKLCPLFQCLSSALALRLEQGAKLRVCAAREVVYAPSDPGQCVLLLGCGRIKIKVITDDGREAILAFIEEGEIFGEHALVDPSPRGEFAEAQTEVTVLEIDREVFLGLMTQHALLSVGVATMIAVRRRRIENRLRNILFHSTRQRVAAVLLELLEIHGEPLKRGWRMGLPLSHQELANLIGATRETVTLTLGRLRDEGTIEIRRRRLVILDRERLAQAIGSDGL